MVTLIACLIATNVALALWLIAVCCSYSVERGRLIGEIKRRDKEILKIVEIAYDNGLPAPALQKINDFMFTHKGIQP